MPLDLISQTRPIHTRTISLSSYPRHQDSLIVQGELLDNRTIPVLDIYGRPKDPGVIHHMEVFLEVKPNPLRIVAAQARMLTVPTSQCHQTLDTMEKLAGLEVKSGFSQRVKSLVGGTEGCVHLCSLVTAMGTEIVHGWLTQKRSLDTSESRVIDPEKAGFFLVDSCRVWKKDGPRYKAVKDALEEKRNTL